VVVAHPVVGVGVDVPEVRPVELRERAIEELPVDRREALIMRFALGMDNREIARAMGRSDGATKVLIHRAIKQLEEIVNVRQAGRH